MDSYNIYNSSGYMVYGACLPRYISAYYNIVFVLRCYDNFDGIHHWHRLISMICCMNVALTRAQRANIFILLQYLQHLAWKHHTLSCTLTKIVRLITVNMHYLLKQNFITKKKKHFCRINQTIFFFREKFSVIYCNLLE